MARKVVDIDVVLIDASPLLTLARVERLQALEHFAVPLKIVDQVAYEASKPDNDVTGRVRDWLERRGNQIDIIETSVGVGFATRRSRDPQTPSRNLGELAVEEYALQHILRGPSHTPLVLFEDPDVLRVEMAQSKRVHLLNTAGLLAGLEARGAFPDGTAVLAQINAARRTPMDVIDRPANTRRLRSAWIRKVVPDVG